MFGYIKASREKSEGNEFGLYHAFFCAICISSKEQFGFRARMLTNFDMAFFNTLFHSFLDIDVEVVFFYHIRTGKAQQVIVAFHLTGNLCKPFPSKILFR